MPGRASSIRHLPRRFTLGPLSTSYGVQGHGPVQDDRQPDARGETLVAARVCIDGFNLSLKRGSGVATYARNLLGCLDDLDFETQILYGPPKILRKTPLLREISLFDASPPASRLSRWLSVADWLRPPLHRRARRIDRSETVIARQMIAQAPPADVTWASTDVFHRANRSYATWRGFTSVSLGAGGPAADVMHWTYPLPMRARGALNLYT